MGTRHRQAVITKEGDLKIQQYGQWDGYPDGQGKDILNYLRNGDLDRYQENLNKIPLINDEQIDEVNKDSNWTKNYPYLSRDCGSNIHQMIEYGVVKFVQHTDLEECQKWCEGFYTIDFQKGVFITEYYDNTVEFDLKKLPTEEEYLKAFVTEDEDA
ncbi:hypothetical protein H9I45_15050 [Polaribacter haliotis]|uniref:Uncharacterized protein n=1 Tax=Polaribacter haliotis TaxID=1888915 RepID=A0A7L8AF46_9FLAO|nr:hypothetical protein [Polaribacter haliotis]QOD60636.1 hypothetical protein H9I45_15050 [Polaribacter haliotis]